MYWCLQNVTSVSPTGLPHLYFKGEVFLQVLYDHDQKGQFNAQGFRGICGTTDERSANVSSNNLQHKRLNVIVCYPLDVSVPHLQKTAETAG